MQLKQLAQRWTVCQAAWPPKSELLRYLKELRNPQADVRVLQEPFFFTCRMLFHNNLCPRTRNWCNLATFDQLNGEQENLPTRVSKSWKIAALQRNIQRYPWGFFLDLVSQSCWSLYLEACLSGHLMPIWSLIQSLRTSWKLLCCSGKARIFDGSLMRSVCPKSGNAYVDGLTSHRTYRIKCDSILTTYFNVARWWRDAGQVTKFPALHLGSRPLPATIQNFFLCLWHSEWQHLTQKERCLDWPPAIQWHVW